MRLMLDPLSAAALVLIIGLVAYNQSRDKSPDNGLHIESFWCLGMCAYVEGEEGVEE